MNLNETIKALEAKGIAVALNLGAHEYCAIDSNCPLAVELRRLMIDAGVTLAELLEGYEAVTAADPMDYTLPEIDGRTSINIAGRAIEVDLTDIVSQEVRDAEIRRLDAIKSLERRVKQLGSGLYNTYLQEIRRARNSRILPQLSFPIRELIEVNCLISGSGDTYTFLFPGKYKPEYLVTRGVRYKMADEDVEAIKREIYLEFKIRNNRFLSTALRDGSGRKLEHYHGNNHSDCWGNVSIPRSWDGSLRSLKRLVDSIMGSLATINLDSLLMREPSGMPHRDRLIEKATEMGREGELGEEAPTGGDTAWGTGDTPRTGWGARRRGQAGGEPAAGELTLDEEMVRRYGRPGVGNEEGHLGTICALCGRPLGNHYGHRAEICPRDHRTGEQ